MKRMLTYMAMCIAAALVCLPAAAQNSGVLHFEVTASGDTVYYDQLPPSYVYAGKKKGRKWRKYYRLVHNFSKVYPYALLAGELLAETDSTIEATHMGRYRKQRYINKLQDKLFKTYEKPLRKLSIKQGQLMLRLVDRETGAPPYDLIRDYKGKVAAGFWQGIGKLFGADLKKRYDPEGIDKQTEELVKIWRKGEFEGFYFSIFGKLPDIPDLGLKYKYGLPSSQSPSKLTDDSEEESVPDQEQ